MFEFWITLWHDIIHALFSYLVFVVMANCLAFAAVVAPSVAVVVIAAEMSQRGHAHSGSTRAGKFVSIFSVYSVNYSLRAALFAPSFMAGIEPC